MAEDKNTSDNLDGSFSLEEIIAEVKSGGAAKNAAPPVSNHILEMPKAEDVIQKAKNEKIVHMDELREEKRRREQQNAVKAPQKSAPWRTNTPMPQPKKQPPKPEEYLEEQQEIEYVDEEEYEEERERIPYDFVNRKYADAAVGSMKCGKKAAKLRIKLIFMTPLVIASIAATIITGMNIPLPVGFSFSEVPFYYVIALCAMQGAAMLLASDVMIAGIYRLIRFRPSMDTLVLFSSCCTLLHGVWMALGSHWESGLPFCSLSILTCYCAVLAKKNRAASLKRTYKASQMATSPVAVKAVMGKDGLTAIKTQENAYVVTEDISRQDSAEHCSAFYAPLAIMTVLALAITASYGIKRGTSLAWALAAIASLCISPGMLLASASPMEKLSKKLFASGTALFSWKTSKRLSRCKRAILFDGDLFPPGSVAITGMKIADGQKLDRVVATAAGVMSQCGSGMAKAFSDFARQQYIPIREADELEFFETGGATAQIGKDLVFVGSQSFLTKMGVKITTGQNIKNGLFMAINTNFVAVFTMKYGVQPQAYVGMRILQHVKIKPVMALKNFNITQAMIEERFDLRSSWAEFPNISKRIVFTSTTDAVKRAEPLASLSRDSMSAYAEVLAAAKKLRCAVRFNIICGVISAVLGVLIMYFMAVQASFGSGSAFNALLFMLLWIIPLWASNLLNTKY